MEFKRIFFLLIFLLLIFLCVKNLNFTKIKVFVDDDIVFGIAQDIGRNRVDVIKSENPTIKIKENFDYENFWIPIEKLKKSAYEILNQLIYLDPKNKVYYLKNYSFYINRLDKIDSSIKKRIEKIKNKNIVVYSDFLDDFAKIYGLNILCHINDLKKPNEILDCIKLIRDKKVKTLFILPSELNKTSEQYSKLLNLKLVILKDIKSGRYLDVMEDNFDMIYNSLNE
ncbi:MAG: metal ABC transporter solute-binding protein, Zn/Mn family [Minisyncoccia bacterium]